MSTWLSPGASSGPCELLRICATEHTTVDCADPNGSRLLRPAHSVASPRVQPAASVGIPVGLVRQEPTIPRKAAGVKSITLASTRLNSGVWTTASSSLCLHQAEFPRGGKASPCVEEKRGRIANAAMVSTRPRTSAEPQRARVCRHRRPAKDQHGITAHPRIRRGAQQRNQFAEAEQQRLRPPTTMVPSRTGSPAVEMAAGT